MNSEHMISENCRTCFSKVHGQWTTVEGQLAMKFEYCLDFNVCLFGVHCVVCEDCVNMIEKFYDFKQKSHKLNTYWLNIVKEETEDCTVKFENNDEMKCEIDVYNESDHMQYESLNHAENEIISKDLIEKDINNLFDHGNPESQGNHEIIEKNHDVISSKRKRNKKKIFERDNYAKVKKRKNKDTSRKLEFCNICNKNFRSNKLFVKHYKLKHEIYVKPSEYYCGLCNFSTDDELIRKKHLEEHFSNNELDCKLCEFQGRDLADMDSHRYSHYPSQYKVACGKCDTRQYNLLKLEFHYRTVHLNKKGGWCKLCNKQFGCYKTWRNHDRKHKGNHFICNTCGNKFLFRSEIISHIRSQHEKIKTHVCDLCGKTFNRIYSLKLHIRSMHTKEPTVVCSHCNKTYKSQYTLLNHLKAVNSAKPYECIVCLKCFENQCSLDNHMIWHSDERPYPCDLCDSKFKSKSSLRDHKLRHSGNLKIKCSYCDKGFITKRSLLIHESIHTGIRLFKCTHCVKSFNHKCTFLKHLATHTAIEDKFVVQ